MPNAGLILEGGGMRGVYTAGVLDCLMDEGLYFQYIYGVSAGACHACSYLSRQRGRAFRTVTDYGKDKRYASLHSLFKTGDYFGAQFSYDEIPKRLIPFDYVTFAEKKEAMIAVLTHCRTGKAHYRQVKDLRTDMEIIRASSSLPLLSRMVELDGELYLDGGIADSVPLEKAVADGHKKCLVVLTQHRGYQKGPNQMLPLIRRSYRDWPQLVEAVRTRHERYNETMNRVYSAEAQGNILILQPKTPVKIGRLEKNIDKLRGLYQEGYRDAGEKLITIRRFFGTPVGMT